MSRRLASSLVLAGLVAATPSLAQVHVGANVEGGLHWAVAAPQAAAWSLVCLFAPVTYEANRYDRRRWTNKITTTGTGARQGRLPQQDGRCTVTKTRGPGPVGVALVRDGVPHAAGVVETGRTAAVGFL